MSSFTQTSHSTQAIPSAIYEFRPSICPVCLKPPPENYIMHQVRIRQLKRYPEVWSMRCRCPRSACRADFSIRLSLTEASDVIVVTWPDAMVFAYAEGEGTAEEIAYKHGLHCASSVWRAVQAAIKHVKEWTDHCKAFIHRHYPESLDWLLRPQPPVYPANRRFHLPDRVRYLSLLKELPRWVKACTEALGKQWPYGVLRFLRNIAPRFDEVCSRQ